MAFPTLQQIAALRQPSGFERLAGALTSGYQAYSQADQARQNREAVTAASAKEAQAANFLKQAVAEQDPQKSEALVAQAFTSSPDIVQKFFDVQKTKSSINSVGGTRYQAVPFETGFKVFDRKTGEFESELIEDKSAADKLAVEIETKKSKSSPLASASEGQKKTAAFARRMFDSANQLDSLEQEIDPTSRVIPFISGGTGVMSEAANRLASPEEQRYATAASDFVTAQLRKESGAAIGEDEFERKYREFFPVVGDSKDQILAKRSRRRKAAEDMSLESGGLYESVYKKETPEMKEEVSTVVITHPEYGSVTEADIAETMKANNLTRKQVLDRLGGK